MAPNDTTILIPRTITEQEIYEHYLRRNGEGLYIGSYEGDGWWMCSISDSELDKHADGRVAILDKCGATRTLSHLVEWIRVSQDSVFFDPGQPISVRAEHTGAFYPAMIMQALNG